MFLSLKQIVKIWEYPFSGQISLDILVLSSVLLVEHALPLTPKSSLCGGGGSKPVGPYPSPFPNPMGQI